MALYVVNRRYSATRDGQRFGSWPVGSEVDLPAADADWINRDSPGTLSPPTAAQGPESEPVTVPDAESVAIDEPERSATPARDRQHRGGRNRAV